MATLKPGEADLRQVGQMNRSVVMRHCERIDALSVEHCKKNHSARLPQFVLQTNVNHGAARLAAIISPLEQRAEYRPQADMDDKHSEEKERRSAADFEAAHLWFSHLQSPDAKYIVSRHDLQSGIAMRTRATGFP
ncbi:MAG: hypothetical protein V4530_07085 [Pseudomonadota bacterium]